MCSSHSEKPAGTSQAGKSAAVSFRVADMTCGHCAATITSAIEAGVPGARVSADPESKLVSVSGNGDAAKLAKLIEAAGYTPVPA
ncbi:MAG: heavy-metal-associated domain-containing protein [Proteobacteria bacterium]|nr:heavy-metal-associated domain-containing protein [Pseudomonadota bacterium]